MAIPTHRSIIKSQYIIFDNHHRSSSSYIGMAHIPQNSLLQGDRLKKELEAQRARAQARAYVQDKGM